jgi:uroporphyrinogen decarboxylase
MNGRERHLKTLLFQTPDQVPLVPGYGRKSTRETWRSQGMKVMGNDYDDILDCAYAEAGLKVRAGRGDLWVSLADTRMIPQFEEKVIEVRPNSQVVQDWKGNICEIGKEFTLDYLRNAIDFVTRSWIKCPVENRADWADMMRRYNADDPVRFAPDFAETVARLKNRTEPLTFGFSGAFWQLREWLGFENLCMLFHDDPAWVGEMIAFWDDFMCRILKKLFQHIVPDVVLVSEDMAYKSFSMISPAMTREFIFPSWKRWGEIVHAAGVPVYDIDSDGFIGELIPLWIEANFQACNPIEVAAGNDIVDFRKRFGRNMAYHGGVDKRAMAKGGRVIEEEIRRIAPVIRDGGFIPSCDHGIPSDVSWPNFVHYVKLLAKETGWE